MVKIFHIIIFCNNLINGFHFSINKSFTFNLLFKNIIYIMNFNQYNYRGILVLFPIDLKYENIVEKYFNIFKKIQISSDNLDKLLTP